VGLVVIVAVVLGASFVLVVVNQYRLLTWQRQSTQLLMGADRALTQAALDIASSRVSLLQYLHSEAATLADALVDVEQALVRLDEVRERVDPELRARIDALRVGLTEYQALVTKAGAAEASEAEHLEMAALSSAADLGAELEAMAADSHQRLVGTDLALRPGSAGRVVLWGTVYGVVICVTLVVVAAVARSIVGPLTALQSGAQRLTRGDGLRGDLGAPPALVVPVEGTDEIGLLARVFNEMAERLAQSHRDLEASVVRRTRDLQRQSAQLRGVIDVSQATADILDVNDLLQRAVDVILQCFELYYVGLFIVDEERDAIVLRAGTGRAGKRMLSRGHQLERGQGMVGWCVANAQARVALEAEADSVRYANPDLPDTRSEAAIPLRARGRVVGALTVQDDEPGTFDDEALELLQVMADLLAVTIENARLYADAQEALMAARRAYGEVTREGWLGILQQRAGRGGLGYRATSASVLAVHSDADSGRDGWTWEVGVPDGVPEACDGHAETLTVSIVARGGQIGAVQLQKAARSGRWSQREVEVVRTVVEQLSVALDSARLFEETQLSAAHERLAREITDKMRATLDWDGLMQATVEEIGRALHASRVYVHWAPQDAEARGQ